MRESPHRANLLLAHLSTDDLREGMPSAMGVGFVDLASGKYSSRAMERHTQSVAAINAWAQANGCDAAIWTALANNFHEPTRQRSRFW
jgi:hypothetical protein